MANDFKFSKGNIESIILNALYNGDKYGYEIAKEIKEKTENRYEIKQPTLYGYLKRLEEQNLIKFYWGEESHGGRRKYYCLTSYGKSVFEQQSSECDINENNFNLSESTEDSVEYTTQENDISAPKSSRKRKSRKDFRNESENQQLFAQLMQLSQTAEEIDTDSYPISVDDCEDAFVEAEEVPTYNVSNENVFKNENFEQAEESFVDEQIYDQQLDFAAEPEISTEIVHEVAEIHSFTPEFDQQQEVDDNFNYVNQKNNLDNDIYQEEYYQPETNFVQDESFCPSEPVLQEEFTQEDIKIETCPVLERKGNEVSQTEIYNEMTFVEIENNQKEELPRLENCDEKFVPKTENIHLDPEVEEIKRQKAEYLNSLLSSVSYEEEKSPVHTPVISQPVQEENEAESQYKQILTNLLGDQIVNTDEKIAQIAPQISSYRNEFTSENLTMAEMADSLAKEGYRIRFYNSTTSQYKAVPMLAKSKINCVTAWATLVAFYALLGLSWLICGAGVNVFAVCATAFAFLLIPSYYTYVYITRPNVRIKSEHDFKHSVINKTLIFVFSTAVLFTLNLLLFKTNLADPADMMHKFIIPELILSMLIVSEIIYSTFLKYKSFYN